MTVQPNDTVIERAQVMETFEVKDPITGEVKNVPTDLKILIGHITSFNRNSKNQKYDELLQEMTVERDSLLEENKQLSDQLKNGSSSADEKVKNIKAEYDKELEKIKIDLESAQNKYSDLNKSYENTIIDNEMMRAISGKGIVHEEDFIQLMKSKGNVQIKDKFDISTGEPTGQKTVVMKLSLPDNKGVKSVVELEATEAVEKYISLEENNHWVSAKLIPGGGGKNSISEEVKGNGKFPTGAGQGIMDALAKAPVKNL